MKRNICSGWSGVKDLFWDKCCWYVAKLTLTLFVKQRHWLCLAAQLPSVPSKLASSHVGCKNDQV